MNDENHIGCLANNITDANYTDGLERLCYQIAERMLDIEVSRAEETQRFDRVSPQDMMFTMERDFLKQIGHRKTFRSVGKVVF